MNCSFFSSSLFSRSVTLKSFSKISILLIVSVFLTPNIARMQAPIEVTFNVQVNCDTPIGENICVSIGNAGGWSVHALKKTGPDTWAKTVNLNFNIGDTIEYKYCRNHIDYGAGESFGPGEKTGWRNLDVTDTTLSTNDSVDKWRWWPVDGVVPDIDPTGYTSLPPPELPRPDFMCGIQFADWWISPFSHSIESFLDEMTRMANANWVEINPVLEITQFAPLPIIDINGGLAIPDADLIKFITEAKKRGLKIFLNPFPYEITAVDPSPNYHDLNWWTEWRNQWRAIILHYAQIAEQYGVEMLSFSMWVALFNIDDAEIPFIDALSVPLLAEVRAAYSGPIAVDYYFRGPILQVFALGDYLMHSIWNCFPWLLDFDTPPSLAEMKANLDEHLDTEMFPAVSTWGKPVIIPQLAAASYTGSTLAEPYFETQLMWNESDPDVPLSLQEQTDGYEAIMSTIIKKDWIVGCFSFMYYLCDMLDKSPSIRAKPAESLLAKWHRWIVPDIVDLTTAANSGGTTNPAPASYVKTKNTTEDISALADPNYAFTGWSGDVPAGQEMDNPLNLVLDADRYIHADFNYLCPDNGDVNNDEVITAADAQIAFTCFLQSHNPTSCEEATSDVNCDGIITPMDAQMIFEHYLGLRTLDPICNGTTSLSGSSILSSASTGFFIMGREIRPNGTVAVSFARNGDSKEKCFGLDIRFDQDHMEFLGLEKTESAGAYAFLDGHQTSADIIRVGGFGGTGMHSSKDVLFKLLFRMKSRSPLESRLRILKMYK